MSNQHPRFTLFETTLAAGFCHLPAESVSAVARQHGNGRHPLTEAARHVCIGLRQTFAILTGFISMLGRSPARTVYEASACNACIDVASQRGRSAAGAGCSRHNAIWHLRQRS